LNNKGSKMTTIDATLMAAGAIIGAGVFTLTGVAVGVAGPGVPVSFLLAGLAVMLANIPHMLLASALPVRGGQYLYAARFLSPLMGFLLVWNTVLETLSIAVVGIAAGQYLPAIIPGISSKMAGALIVIAIITICLFNIKTSAKVQNTMVILILMALGLFIIMGIPRIKYWSFTDMFAVKGLSGILAAVSYVRYAAWGGTNIVNLAGEIENPGRTVPRAIAVSTLSISALYAVIAAVAVGVVPWKQMIRQPLSIAAETFMPSWMFKFFVIGGALFALLTSMLALIMDYSRGVWAAAEDGLFPAWLGATNKYGVPHRIILLTGAIGLMPILLELPLDYVFAMMNAPGMLLGLLATIPAVLAPKKLPHKFENAWFKLPYGLIVAIVLINMAVTLFFCYSLFATLTLPTILGIVAFYGGGTVYFYARVNQLKRKGIDLRGKMAAYDPSWVS
jgi:APA family basic amino acid/polyamine antiporter